MSNTTLFEGLQTDIRNLSQEIRKKHPNIKEAAEKSLLKLRQLEDLYSKNQNVTIDKNLIDEISSEEMLKPLLLTCEVKYQKAFPIVLSAFYKLFVHKSISLNSASKIIYKIIPFASTGDENIQLKILQLLLAAVTTLPDLHATDSGELRQIFCTCFQLQASKNAPVYNTASATLRQLTVMLFDRASIENQGLDNSNANTENNNATPNDNALTTKTVGTPNQSPLTMAKSTSTNSVLNRRVSGTLIAPPNLLPCARDAYLLFQDITYMVGGEPPRWLLELETISRTFGLELIESVLANHFKLFKAVSEFLVLVCDRVCPLIIKFMTVQLDFSSTLRLTKVISTFVRNFCDVLSPESEMLVSRILTSLNQRGVPFWAKGLVLESFKQIAESVHIMHSLSITTDQAFPGFLLIFGQFVQSMYLWEDQSIVRKNNFKYKLSELHTVTEAPSIADVYLVNLSLDSLLGIINSIYILSISSETKKFAMNIITNSWTTLLSCLSLLLQKSPDENLNQEVLKSYQTLTNCCGTLGLSLPRDAFLTSLCKFTLPDYENSLTSKNMQCMKTLLNIAHCMGDILNESWEIVLETFQHLDKFWYTTPYRPIQDTVSEVNILAQALDSLVTSTQPVTDESLLHIIRSLKKISQEAVMSSVILTLLKEKPDWTEFGASKMLETSKTNIHRISIFWDIVRDHFMELSQNKDERIRIIGIDALTQIITIALSHKHTNTNYTNPLDMQIEFIETLERLGNSSYGEAKSKSLNTLYQVLRNSGQSLTFAWTTILSMIMTVAVNNGKAFVPIGFRSAQLICTDFVTYLSPDCLALFITTCGCYALQTADLNIALTSINLLMTVADHLTTLPSTRVEIDATLSNSSEKRSLSLWVAVLAEMKQLGGDARSEVRNCAAQTLFKTITTHGLLLDKDSWSIIIFKILFPLIDQVTIATSGASDDILESSEGNFKLLVHHTRNTVSKQWSETLSLTLSGLVRVFRTFYPVFYEILNYSFETIWKKILNVMEQLVAYRSSEVSVTTLQLFQDLLTISDKKNILPREFWETSWNILEQVPNNLEPQSPDVLQSQKALVKTISFVYSKEKSQFNLEDIKRMLRIFRKLNLVPNESSLEISSLQQISYETIKTIPLTSETIPHIVIELLYFISYSIGYKYTNTITEATFSISTQLEKQFLSFAMKCVDFLNNIFQEATVEIRVKIFYDIIKVLGSALITKFTRIGYSSNFWILSLSTFIDIIKLGLEDLNRSDLSDIQLNLIWTEIADSIQSFLFYPDRSILQNSTEVEKQRDDEKDLKLIELLANHILSVSKKVPLLHERLIEILCEGTTLFSVNRQSISSQCYYLLFSLCHLAGKNEEEFSCFAKIGQLTFPILSKRIVIVIENFIKSDSLSEVTTFQQDEMNLILDQLRELTLEPSVYSQTVFKMAFPLSSPITHYTGKKFHLFKFFPLLSQCVLVKDSSIKSKLKLLFDEITLQLQL